MNWISITLCGIIRDPLILCAAEKTQRGFTKTLVGEEEQDLMLFPGGRVHRGCYLLNGRDGKAKERVSGRPGTGVLEGAGGRHLGLRGMSSEAHRSGHQTNEGSQR